MSKQKVALTPRQFNRLMSEMLAHPNEPVVGAHLSDDQFVYYSLGEITREEEMEKIDRHINSCPRCLLEMERLVEAADAWRGSEAEERFKRKQVEIKAGISSKMPLATRPDRPSPDPRSGPQHVTLLAEIALAGAGTGAAMAAVDGQIPGGALSWRIVEDHAKNLILRFKARDQSLFGTRLQLSAAKWRRVLSITVIEADQVGARTVITREERERMRAGTPLRLDFFLGNM